MIGREAGDRVVTTCAPEGPYPQSMWSWIITFGLYALGMSVLCLLGGVGAAGDAFRKWGETAARHHRASSVS